jgi:hypothetical protein
VSTCSTRSISMHAAAAGQKLSLARQTSRESVTNSSRPSRKRDCTLGKTRVSQGPTSS